MSPTEPTDQTGRPASRGTDIISPQMQCRGKYTTSVPNVLSKTVKLKSNQVSASTSSLQEMPEIQERGGTLPPGSNQMNPKCENFCRTTELVSPAKQISDVGRFSRERDFRDRKARRKATCKVWTLRGSQLKQKAF